MVLSTIMAVLISRKMLPSTVFPSFQFGTRVSSQMHESSHCRNLSMAPKKSNLLIGRMFFPTVEHCTCDISKIDHPNVHA